MKRFWQVLMAGLAVAAVLPMGLVFAQKSLPQVPITYPGDTNETIVRRAKWIEGARKEGRLVWWGTVPPKEKMAIMAEFNKVYPFIKLEAGGEVPKKRLPSWSLIGVLNVIAVTYLKEGVIIFRGGEKWE